MPEWKGATYRLLWDLHGTLSRLDFEHAARGSRRELSVWEQAGMFCPIDGMEQFLGKLKHEGCLHILTTSATRAILNATELPRGLFAGFFSREDLYNPVPEYPPKSPKDYRRVCEKSMSIKRPEVLANWGMVIGDDEKVDAPQIPGVLFIHVDKIPYQNPDYFKLLHSTIRLFTRSGVEVDTTYKGLLQRTGGKTVVRMNNGSVLIDPDNTGKNILRLSH